MKQYALICGVAYLLIFIAGFYANFTILESLVEWDNMAITTQNFIHFHPELKRGLLSFCTMLLLDVVLVFTLIPLTHRAHKGWTYAASTLRMLHAMGFAIGLYGLFEVYGLTSRPSDRMENLYPMVQQALHHFNTSWTLALLVFGLHLFGLGYLSIRFGAFPKFIGFFLVLAASGYVVDGTAKFLLPSYFDYRDLFESIVVLTGIVGEFTLTLWLLTKGFVGFTTNAE